MFLKIIFFFMTCACVSKFLKSINYECKYSSAPIVETEHMNKPFKRMLLTEKQTCIYMQAVHTGIAVNHTILYDNYFDM